MVKILIKIANYCFSKKEYLNKEKQLGYKTRTKNNLKKELDKQISNKLDLRKKEKEKELAISILLEIIDENPNYYTEKEINYLVKELA